VTAGPGGLSEQRFQPLDPAVDGGVVELDAALGEQLLDVAVRQAEAEVLAHRQHDHLERMAKASEGRELNRAGHRQRGMGGEVSGHSLRARDSFTADATAPLNPS
jgi:hypothetical protein